MPHSAPLQTLQKDVLFYLSGFIYCITVVCVLGFVSFIVLVYIYVYIDISAVKNIIFHQKDRR